MSAAANILRRALQLMNDKGAHWTKGTYRDTGGPNGSERYCSVGALLRARSEFERAGRYSGYSRAVGALSEEVTSPGVDLDPWERVVLWNDQDERTWDEVRAAFEQAIKKLETSDAS